MSFSDAPLTSIGTSYYHRLAEAFKHTFAMRMSLGDPAFTNITAVLQAFLGDNNNNHNNNNDDKGGSDIGSDSYLYNLYKTYYDDNYVLSSPDVYGGDLFNHLNDNPQAYNKYDTRVNMKEDHGTSHFAAVDVYGNAVSITTTINTYLGSKVIIQCNVIQYNIL